MDNKMRSSTKPEPIVIDEFSVWVHSNIQFVENTIDDRTDSYWEYDVVQYSKDDYIHLMDKQLTDTQIALCDVYELIGG